MLQIIYLISAHTLNACIQFNCLLQLSQRNEINNVNLHTSSNVEAFPSQSNTVNLPPLLQTQPNPRGKHNGKSKVSKNSKSANQISNTGNFLLEYDNVRWFVYHYLYSHIIFILCWVDFSYQTL